MIEVKLARWIHKYLGTPKRCSRELQKKFIDEMEVLYDDPEAGEVLVGDLRGHYSIDFKFKNVDYRIVYAILSDEEILVVYCGTRENAYQVIKRNL